MLPTAYENEGSHFCYVTKQTQQKREALVQQGNVMDNSIVKTQNSNSIKNWSG